jgi:hypothetical protein
VSGRVIFAGKMRDLLYDDHAGITFETTELLYNSRDE